MKEGDVVLTPLPQADGAMKNRPAIVLRVMPPFGDRLVCGVSSQLHQRAPVSTMLLRRSTTTLCRAVLNPIH